MGTDRKDFLLRSDLHFGAISLWLKVLLLITPRAWSECEGLFIIDLSLESILHCDCVKCYTDNRASLFDQFVDSVSISQAGTLSPAHHSKEQSTSHHCLMDAAQ